MEEGGHHMRTEVANDWGHQRKSCQKWDFTVHLWVIMKCNHMKIRKH